MVENGVKRAPGWLKIVRFWPLLLLPALLLPFLNTYAYPHSQSEFSDITITHEPYALFLRQTIIEDHQIPLWDPSILSGTPFFANPLSGLYYPPGWLALLLPLPFGFNLLILVHLLLGGLGAYCLLREEGLIQEAAILGALAFAALPKLFAHYGAGHLTLLYAVPWTPWLLWAEARSGMGKARPRWLQPGLFLAVIFLADVRWSLLAGLLWLGFAIRRRATWTHLIRQGVLAGLLSAPLALPLIQFTRLATRSSMSSGDVFTYSLPPARLLGAFIPDFGGFQEYTLYTGEFILALALVTMVSKTLRPRARFWWILAGLSILLSLGSWTPLFAALAWLPGFNLLRVPSRALFLFGLSFAMLAAYALDGILKPLLADERRAINLALVALAAFTAGMAGLMIAISGRLALNLAWAAVAVVLAAVWVGLGVNQRLKLRVWLTLLFVFTMIDLGVFDRQAFAPRSLQDVQADGLPAAQFLAQQPGVFRVYSPSYSLPQQTAQRAGLELADGVDPLQLSAYVTFMNSASGVPPAGYSVTLPPFANGDPERDNTAYRPDLQQLGLLNVRYVASAFDLADPNLKLLENLSGTRIYENLVARPRAWVQDGLDISNNIKENGLKPAELLSRTPNRISIQIPALNPSKEYILVTSEVAYPGWRAWVDGKPAQLLVVDGLFRAVRVQGSAHQVVFSFFPLSLVAGLALWGCGLIFLWFLMSKSHHAQPITAFQGGEGE